MTVHRGRARVLIVAGIALYTLSEDEKTRHTGMVYSSDKC